MHLAVSPTSFAVALSVVAPAHSNATMAAAVDAAYENKIVEHAADNDIVITSDIPLAAKTVAKGAITLRHNGDEFTRQNIGGQLATRDLMADLRAADPLMTGAGKQQARAFSKQDKSRFLERLEAAVRKAQ